MKKYVKPELFYEHFELAQHIADCAWEWVNSTDGNTCTLEPDTALLPGHGNIFTDGRCDGTPGVYEDYCEFNSTGGANTFQS